MRLRIRWERRIERKQVSELVAQRPQLGNTDRACSLVGGYELQQQQQSTQHPRGRAGPGRQQLHLRRRRRHQRHQPGQQPYVRLAIPLDTIQEFRVVSMLATAETGATAGGQMAVTSASGTNQFHGSAFRVSFATTSSMRASFIDPDQATVSLESVRRQLGRTHCARQDFLLCRL